jgi:hypothetical protein
MVWTVICGIRSAQPIGQFHEGAEQGGAVVVHQLDQPGLLSRGLA